MICDKCEKVKTSLLFAREKRAGAATKWICNKCINENYRQEIRVRNAKGYPQFNPKEIKI